MEDSQQRLMIMFGENTCHVSPAPQLKDLVSIQIMQLNNNNICIVILDLQLQKYLNDQTPLKKNLVRLPVQLPTLADGNPVLTMVLKMLNYIAWFMDTKQS